MQVALEAPALLVLRLDEPLARGTQFVEALLQLGGEADVAHHQSRLVREVLNQLLTRWASMTRPFA